MPRPASADEDANGGAPAAPKKSNTGMILAIVGGVVALSCCVCGGGAFGIYQFVYKPGNFDKNFGKDLGQAGKGIVAGGPTIFTKNETLTAKDQGIVNGKPTKTYKVKLEAGKEYIIDMKATGKGFVHDPYLVLLDPQNKEVMRDDDSGGGLDAQIRYTPNVTGDFTIQATVQGAVPPEGLPFALTVKLK